jgi:hypothetical protein
LVAHLQFYEAETRDYDRPNEKLCLEIAESHGRIIVGIGVLDTVQGWKRCAFDIHEARKVLEALEKAVSRIGYP